MSFSAFPIFIVPSFEEDIKATSTVLIQKDSCCALAGLRESLVTSLVRSITITSPLSLSSSEFPSPELNAMMEFSITFLSETCRATSNCASSFANNACRSNITRESEVAAFATNEPDAAVLLWNLSKSSSSSSLSNSEDNRASLCPIVFSPSSSSSSSSTNSSSSSALSSPSWSIFVLLVESVTVKASPPLSPGPITTLLLFAFLFFDGDVSSSFSFTSSTGYTFPDAPFHDKRAKSTLTF
mmetsp:Transcript_8954/g.13546  ORF Transcript_8954/g.13546 Transcript_8954/m.13546 type:complete len:241 (-) Transcript_8954:997-1719(-)